MQETNRGVPPGPEDTQEQKTGAISLHNLPEAFLQIVQASTLLNEEWLDRSMIEPKLTRNTDGLWMLTVRRQGEHSKFAVPFIGSEIILADSELGLVVVLVGYHGSATEKYGRLGYLTQKGQFYRYYLQGPLGVWAQVQWHTLNDEIRSLILSTVEGQGPQWARTPGKLQSERKPPSKPVTMTSYKVVRYVDERYYSLYDPTVEYVLGERLKEPAKPKHEGGFFSFPTLEEGMQFLTECVECIPFHKNLPTPQIALIECEIGGPIIHYGHKMASTYLRPIRVLEVRAYTGK